MNALSQKVSMAEKIGYSLGDCSANLVFQMMMIYQTKFYTDVFGLEGAIAGSVMLIARIVDAFVDPTVGILSDRTQTKWGKYRPWVLWTALPFMLPIPSVPTIIHPSIKPSHNIDEDIQDTEEYVEESLSLDEVEKEMIRKALEKHHGKRKSAAKDLNISERTLYRKIKEYGLD